MLRRMCSLLSGRPWPAIMLAAATPSLAKRLMRGRMPSTTTPSFSSALARLAGAPDHERRSRGSPNTQVMATRSKRSEAAPMMWGGAFIATHGNIAPAGAASDQPVTGFCTAPTPQIDHVCSQRRSLILRSLAGTALADTPLGRRHRMHGSMNARDVADIAVSRHEAQLDTGTTPHTKASELLFF